MVSAVVIPALLVVFGAHYTAEVTLTQAGEQEASAQAGAERAKDAELAKEPAVSARVRPVHEDFWVWVYPEPVDESVLRAGGLGKSPEERYRLFREQRGVMGGWIPMKIGDVWKKTSRYQVSLVGNRRETVRVLDMRARVIEKTPPLDGTLLTFPPQGEGDVREVLLDLDDPRGRLLLPAEAGSDAAPKPFFDVKYLTLTKGEEVALDLTALTEKHHYKWELELTVAYDGVAEEKVRVTSDGSAGGPPFEAAAWKDIHAEGGAYPYRGGIYEIQDGGAGGLVKVG
ncbi:hypothetical protein FHS29_003737 [Saccharothrix tamanrassetensis]|uniref:Uncharacterized protein n=1 Tax=Saccharothrix tamanrassetensis TaxID=1051531 RepID=A0A841CL99_9PSEU|nr:hypothetical protein [Saccharothrix tamanrassetensis]MBB5957144.1 hypothetical protein [Saccharothrix tamanrassetensis]